MNRKKYIRAITRKPLFLIRILGAIHRLIGKTQEGFVLEIDRRSKNYEALVREAEIPKIELYGDRDDNKMITTNEAVELRKARKKKREIKEKTRFELKVEAIRAAKEEIVATYLNGYIKREVKSSEERRDA